MKRTNRMHRSLGTLLVVFAMGAFSTVVRADNTPAEWVAAINHAGAEGRSGNSGQTALAVLLANAGASQVQHLAAQVAAGTADATVVQALQDNQFLPTPGIGQTITGKLEDGVITDRLTGQEYKVYGGTTPFRPTDLYGFDDRVVTLKGEVGQVNGEPAIVYTEMAPGETHSFVNGRLIPPNQYDAKIRQELGNDVVVIRGGGNRQLVVKNPELAALFKNFRSETYGGVGIIVPGQIKAVMDGDNVKYYELHTGGDTGVQAVPDFWVLTDIYGNGYGRTRIGWGKYLYKSEVYDGNKIVATVGPKFKNKRARHMFYGTPLPDFEAFARETGVEDKDYRDDKNQTFNPAPHEGDAANNRPRRFMVVSEITRDLSDSNYVRTGNIQQGSSVSRLAATQITDPGVFRGFGKDDFSHPVSPSDDVKRVIQMGHSRD